MRDDDDGQQATGETATSTAAEEDAFESAQSCTLTPELTEGPYYFDVDKIRSDIREDKEGVALQLGIRVRDAESCEPLPNCVVDIWHCDAAGSYSGFNEEGTFLRGAQVHERRRAHRRSSPRSIRAGTWAARCTSTPRRTSTTQPC